MRLKDKIAVITGAASGIGLSTAELFAQNGARVILTDIDDARGTAAAKKIDGESRYRHLDVSKEQDWKLTYDWILDKYGYIDILVNNAGITGLLNNSQAHNPENFDTKEWQHVHNVNTLGTALGCKTAISLMLRSEAGSIVNISSRSGVVGIPHAAAYASSKASVRNHTKSVALYCAEKGYPIRCNSLHPGAILTPMWDPMLGSGQARKNAIANVAKDIPLKRMGSVYDVAYAALFLASDESAYITGIELNIDGGILAGSAANIDNSGADNSA